MSAVELSAEEKQWLHTHPRLTVLGYGTYPPLLYPYQTGQKPKGMAIDYINYIFAHLGIEPEFKNMQSLAAARKNLELFPIAVSSALLQKNWAISIPYYRSAVVIFSRLDKPVIPSLREFTNGKIAYPQNAVFAEALKSEHPELYWVAQASNLKMFHALNKGEIDAAVATLLVGSTIIQELGLKNVKIMTTTDLPLLGISISTHPQNQIFINIANKVLNSISTKQHHDIQSRWLSPVTQETTDWTLALSWAGLGVIITVLILIPIWISRFNLKLSLNRKSVIEAYLHKLNKQLEKEAKTDTLAGIGNRAKFNLELARCIQLWERQQTPFALVSLDLDNFKRVNDMFGHSTGDRVISTVGKLLNDITRSNDFATRTGGDEFALLILGIDQQEDVLRPLGRFTNNFNREMQEHIEKVQLGFSVGIAFCPSDGSDAKNLINNADKALYQSKNNKYNSYCFYSLLT